MFPVLLLVMGVEMKAADDFDVRVSGNQMLTVELDKVEKGTILFFEDKNGEVLFQDRLANNGHYSKAFNLEVIPAGVYYLKLEKENSIQTTEVTKSQQGLKLSGKSSSIVFKPCFKVENKLVRVFLTNPGESTAYFNVYDRNGNLVHSLAYDDLVVNRTFDFSKVPAGEYIISVKVGGNTFHRTVKLI